MTHRLEFVIRCSPRTGAFQLRQGGDDCVTQLILSWMCAEHPTSTAKYANLCFNMRHFRCLHFEQSESDWKSIEASVRDGNGAAFEIREVQGFETRNQRGSGRCWWCRWHGRRCRQAYRAIFRPRSATYGWARCTSCGCRSNSCGNRCSSVLISLLDAGVVKLNSGTSKLTSENTIMAKLKQVLCLHFFRSLT